LITGFRAAWAWGRISNTSSAGTARASLKYYYAWDRSPGTDPVNGTDLPNHRQRTYFSYDSNPWTNMTVMSQVAYQSDPYIVRDFFESQYTRTPSPTPSWMRTRRSGTGAWMQSCNRA